MCDRIEAPKVQHFLNSRGIQPAVFDPVGAPKIVKKEVFSPGEVKVILPPPDIKALRGEDQKPKSLNFPFKKPDTLNMEFVKKYDFFDPMQRTLAAAELKELAKLEANTEKLRKDMVKLNQVQFMTSRREEAAKEKLSEIEAWEQATYPGNPLNATKQALSNASETAALQRIYDARVAEDAENEKMLERELANTIREAKNEERKVTALEKLRQMEAETKERNMMRKERQMMGAEDRKPTLLQSVISATAPVVAPLISQAISSISNGRNQSRRNALTEPFTSRASVSAVERQMMGAEDKASDLARNIETVLKEVQQKRDTTALQQLRQIEAETKARNQRRKDEAINREVAQSLNSMIGQLEQSQPEQVKRRRPEVSPESRRPTAYLHGLRDVLKGTPQEKERQRERIDRFMTQRQQIKEANLEARSKELKEKAFNALMMNKYEKGLKKL